MIDEEWADVVRFLQQQPNWFLDHGGHQETILRSPDFCRSRNGTCTINNDEPGNTNIVCISFRTYNMIRYDSFM